MALWEDYLNQIVRQGMDVSTGRTMPSELPQYRYLESGVTQNINQLMKGLFNYLGRTGMTGAGAEQMMSRLWEEGLKGRLGAERAAWEGAQTGAMQGATGLENWAKQLMDYAMLQQQIRSQERIAKMGQISGAASSGMSRGGGGCCFIMLEVDDLTQEVRLFRDTHFGHDSYIANGYRTMAKVLVPLMKRSRIIKHLVKSLMTSPLAKYAHYYYEKNPNIIIYVPFRYFWTSIWSLLGRLI